MYKICHTEASSRRQRELEAGLLAAMENQRYEKITLTELCKALDIPRKSFYRYFPTKEDCLLGLIDHTLSDCNTVALGGWEGSGELQKIHLQRFFSYWQGRKPFLDAVADNDLTDLLMRRTGRIVDAMKEASPQESFARDQVEYFVAWGLMATVVRWHRMGFPCPPEELARMFAQVLRSPDVSLSKLIL